MRQLSLTIVSIGVLCGAVPSAQWGAHGGAWEPQFQYAPLSDQHSIESNNAAMASIGDLNGDQIPELVFASEGYNSSIPALVCLNGESGDLEWIFEYYSYFSSDAPSISGCIVALDDLNGDGVPEVLCGDPTAATGNSFQMRGAVFLHSGIDGALIWHASAMDWGDSIGVGAAKTDDLDGDGVCDFSVSVRGDYAQTWDSAVHVFSGKTQDHLRTFRFDGSESLSSLSLGYAPPGVDLDLDGLGDLLIPVGQTFHWGTSVVSSVTGQALAWIPGEIADYNSQSVVSFVQDLDGDSIPEIALMRPDQLGCSLFSTQTGALMWTQEWLNGPVATSMCTVADIDGDQIEDLAVGSPFLPVKGFAGSGKVHFLSGATGERIRRLDCEVTGDLNSDRFGVNLLWDSASETLFVRSDYGFLGTESRPVVGLQFLPFLELSDCELSAASGGHLDVWIDFPEEYQSVRYALLASRLPGESTAPSGVVIPLGMSRLFRDSVNDQLPPWFSGRTGTLNLAGDATVDLAVPSGALSVLTGSSIWFAAVAGDRNDVQVSSIAQELSIVH